MVGGYAVRKMSQFQCIVPKSAKIGQPGCLEWTPAAWDPPRYPTMAPVEGTASLFGKLGAVESLGGGLCGPQDVPIPVYSSETHTITATGVPGMDCSSLGAPKHPPMGPMEVFESLFGKLGTVEGRGGGYVVCKMSQFHYRVPKSALIGQPGCLEWTPAAWEPPRHPTMAQWRVQHPYLVSWGQ